jgi:hypothetical protein
MAEHSMTICLRYGYPDVIVPNASSIGFGCFPHTSHYNRDTQCQSLQEEKDHSNRTRVQNVETSVDCLGIARNRLIEQVV